jgi:hypothetical protein
MCTCTCTHTYVFCCVSAASSRLSVATLPELGEVGDAADSDKGVEVHVDPDSRQGSY